MLIISLKKILILRWYKSCTLALQLQRIFLKFDLMSTATDINATIIDGYLRLLDNLTPSSKLDLISKLTTSIKSDISNKKKSFKKAFGAFQSNQTAEELIEEIRSSRISTRQIESF